MPTQRGGDSLSGELITVPFESSGHVSTIRKAYENLTAIHGADRVLILNRYPAGTSELEDELAAAVNTVERPRINVVARHAERVVEGLDPSPKVVARDERTVLVREFLTEREWDDPYLQRAAEKDGFRADFLRFLITASYQQPPDAITNPRLAELYEAVADYHVFCREEFAERGGPEDGYLDRAHVLVTAIELLNDDEIASSVREEYDAVLALEFEEFDATSRTYLERLSRDKELVAISQSESAVRRLFSEPGRVEDAVPGLSERMSGDSAANPLEAMSRFLGTGTATNGLEDLSEVSRRIEANTFRDHVRAIAREIEALHKNGIAYDEIAVVLRDSEAPIAETNDILRARGLPTTSATVRGFEHDPAARELLAVARWLAATVEDADIDAEQTLATLQARVAASGDADVAADLVEEALNDAMAAPDVHAGLWRWIMASGLKARIATEAEPLEARIRYEHVEQLTDLAEFLGSENIDADWTRVVTEFEEKFEHEAIDQVSEDLDTVGGAVRVEAARSVKSLDFKFVFLAGVVEGEYPHDPNFGSLFSRRQLRNLPDYPTVTAPSPDDVRETFGLASTADDGRAARAPLDAYYSQIARRMLAIGTRAATDGVYFCTYQQERGLGQRRRPSRFLLELETAFSPLITLDEEASGETDPEQFALGRVEDAVDTVRQGAIRNEPVDFDRIDREFGAVQSILDSADDQELRRAIESRIDFLRGRVRRD